MLRLMDVKSDEFEFEEEAPPLAGHIDLVKDGVPCDSVEDIVARVEVDRVMSLVKFNLSIEQELAMMNFGDNSCLRVNHNDDVQT